MELYYPLHHFQFSAANLNLLAEANRMKYPGL